jgi:hypothetical protein
LTSALDGGEWSASRRSRFTPRERAPGNHWIGGWVGPRAVLDAVKRKLLLIIIIIIIIIYIISLQNGQYFCNNVYVSVLNIEMYEKLPSNYV